MAVVEILTAPVWERQPKEPKKAYWLFEQYLSLKSRRYKDLAAVTGKNERTLRNYSSTYSWPQRARAYDEQASREVKAEVCRRTVSLPLDNLALMSAIKENGLEAILKHIQYWNRPGVDVSKIPRTVLECTKWVESVESQIRAEHREDVTIDLSDLADEYLERLCRTASE